MSTELKTLKAKIEVPDYAHKDSAYKDTEVLLNSFPGGLVRGHSLQITFLNEKGEYSHIQLDNENVRELIRVLTETYLY